MRLLFHRLLLAVCCEAHAANNMRIILPFKLWLDAYLILVFVVGVVLRVHRLLLLLLRIVDYSGRAGDRELGPNIRQRQLLEPSLALRVTIYELCLVLWVKRPELDWLLDLDVIALVRSKCLTLLHRLRLNLEIPRTFSAHIVTILYRTLNIISE